MRVTIVRYTLAVCACAAVPVLAYELDKPVQVDTNALPPHVAQQVQSHAADSTKALMEYLWFTRRIHHLWIDDVTRSKPDAVAANDARSEPRQMATRTTGLR